MSCYATRTQQQCITSWLYKQLLWLYALLCQPRQCQVVLQVESFGAQALSWLVDQAVLQIRVVQGVTPQWIAVISFD